MQKSDAFLRWKSAHGDYARAFSSTRLTADYTSHAGFHTQQTVYCELGTDGKNDIGRRWKQVPVQTKNFPHQPLDPVTPYRITGFPMHADPQPIVLERVRQDDHGKAVASKPPTGKVNALKIAGRSQQMVFRESVSIQATQAANCLRPFALLLLITA